MININIKKSDKCNGDYSLFISFPYDQHIVNVMREQTIRYWHPDSKEWEVPYKSLDKLKDMLKDYDLDIKSTSEIKAELFLNNHQYNYIPKDFKFKTNPFKHQIEGIEYGLKYDRFLLGDEQGLGKALALNTKIYTPRGYKFMKDIKVGDYVFNKKGYPTKVTQIFNHKNVEMYRFTFSDGVTIDCCKDHLWKIYSGKSTKIVDTNWFLKEDQFGKIRKDNLFSGGSYKYYIDVCDEVQFESKPIIINPYILGALLGDGSLTGGSISFTSKDNEIINKINKNLPEGYILNSSNSMSNIDYNIVRIGVKTTTKNIIKQEIKNLGLLNTNSHNKFIPDIYKYNSIDVRLNVLQGLIDTDGYATKNNLLQYTTVSKQLAEDVRFLVESLGGFCNLSISDCRYNGKITGKCYTLTIRCNNPSKFCSLTRKKNLLKERKFKPRRNIIKIEKICNSDAKCITVDDEEHLYLAEHFIVTHNTKQIIDLAVIKKLQKGYKHCLIICGVNGLKWNWRDEVSKHSNESAYILGTRYDKRGKEKIGSMNDRLEDLENLLSPKKSDNLFNEEYPYFLITNIETLRNENIISKLKELCDKNIINMIALDERSSL